MDLPMARGADRDLFPVQGLHNGLETGGFLGPHLADMSHMVHLHLYKRGTDAARFAQFRACSHPCRSSKQIGRLLICGKSVPLLFPVTVEVEHDLTIPFSILGFDWDRERVPKSAEDLLHGEFEFCREGLGKRVFQNVLDSREVREIVCEAILVLYPSVDTTVETHYLVRIQVHPAFLGGWASFSGAKASLGEPLDEAFHGSCHHDF
jgi:hypothetical protein